MDLVSNLPDGVLCHILSFLPTKQAALTSVLSTKWRDLLAFVPCLDIDNSVFLHPEVGKREWPEIIQSFMAFVDRILALQGNSLIKKFSLKCLTGFDSDRVDGWINNVLVRGVSDLDLLIILDCEGDNYRLSPKGFECSTLVKLKINIGIEIGWVAGTIFLPILKTLVLDSPRIDKFDILLPALPALEELVLVDVLCYDQDVNISSASLKRLTITKCSSFDTLSIDTPSLVYFKYYGYVADDYPVVNMKNLLEAQISFLLTEEGLRQAREPDHLINQSIALGHSNMWKLFHGIRNVSDLYLSPNTLEVLSLCCETMPMFNNLKSLVIESDEERGWQAMPILLRNCPHLETLFIEGLLHHETDKCGDACDCISREEKGHSLTSCPVKILQIQGFQGTMKEMSMIKHFLEYFPCLKEMEIYVAENEPTAFRVPEMSELIVQIIESTKNYRVAMSSSWNLHEKWIAKGHVL